MNKNILLKDRFAEEPIRKACIIVPTYNESKNIKTALDLIFSNFKDQKTKRKFGVEVLVVDDNSPDGTASIVQEYQKTNPAVHLLLRKGKEGLGKAYIAGMKHALENFEADAICQMDADLSHDPKDLLRLLARLDQGYDMVIGSRYVKGGSIPSNWGLDRRIKSKLATTVTRIGLRLGNIKDCSGGFKAIRASSLQKIDLDNLEVRGYAFQAVIIEAMLHEGGIISEVPIKFTDRELGNSKMGINELFEGWSVIFRVRLKRLLERKQKQVVLQSTEPLDRTPFAMNIPSLKNPN